MIKKAYEILNNCQLPIFGAIPFSQELVIPNVASARRIPQNCKTIILALFPYYVEAFPNRNLSLYSILPDYHHIAGDILNFAAAELKKAFPENHFQYFVDASPINEVVAATFAGLGDIGKNNQLISKEYGSFVFIGEILTDLDLNAKTTAITHCQSCNACVKACPTKALEDNHFNKSLCRSHFSQKKGELTPWEQQQLADGGFAWGCDICTVVCPCNQQPKQTPITAFKADCQPTLTTQNLEALIKNRAFAWRGEQVLQRNLTLLKF